MINVEHSKRALETMIKESEAKDMDQELHAADDEPTEKGWYECYAVDDRWNGEMRYRAYGNGAWWIPLPDGWLSSPVGLYRWRGPVADVNGPAPDGTNPEKK